MEINQELRNTALCYAVELFKSADAFNIADVLNAAQNFYEFLKEDESEDDENLQAANH